MKKWRKNSKITSSWKENLSSLSKQNSTQEVNERENRIRFVWPGKVLQFWRTKRREPYCRGITKPRTFGKTSTRSKSHPGKSYKLSETRERRWNNNKTFLMADSSLLQRTLMASRKLNHRETKETSKRNHKANLKGNLPTATKRKMLIKRAKGTLENCTQRKRVLHTSPSVTSVQNRSLGAGLEKFKTRKSIWSCWRRRIFLSRRNHGRLWSPKQPHKVTMDCNRSCGQETS